MGLSNILLIVVGVLLLISIVLLISVKVMQVIKDRKSRKGKGHDGL